MDVSNKKTSRLPMEPISKISPVPSISNCNGIQRKQNFKKTPTVLTTSPFLKELRQKFGKEKKEKFYETEMFDDLDVDADDCPCLYCNELYSHSRPGEHWLKCQLCNKWAHTDCAELNNRAKNFVCDVCK
ncbi:hypothetical protein RN001_015818 [Aquatica leii]|uniref:Zinc finger PHD-type domain-containing protein n=1 Tax=Aquatica leii TaxID=1421715 RepID=A0AAN7SB30_9COLE|nr:hypothetical protein RN001_015818 [Aquatica leii]